MVHAGHENRPGYLLGAIALSYADSLIGDPGAGFDAMLAAERAAAAKRVILLAWLLIAEDTSAGAKVTPLAVLPWSLYKGRWLAQSMALRDRTATWTKLAKTAMEVVATLESGIAVRTGASKRFAVALSFPGEKRAYVEGVEADMAPAVVPPNRSATRKSNRRRVRTPIDATADHYRWHKAYCDARKAGGRVNQKELARGQGATYPEFRRVIKRLESRRKTQQ